MPGCYFSRAKGVIRSVYVRRPVAAKNFKKEFHTKETRKKRDRKDEVLQILEQFTGTYLRECPGNNVL